MRAVTWHGKRDVRVDTVPDPAIELATDAIVRVTSSGICGADLHLYEVMGRMGQANVRRWVDDIMPLVSGDGDPLGVEGFATHRVALDAAPEAYERFQRKQDGHFKVLLQH